MVKLWHKNARLPYEILFYIYDDKKISDKHCAKKWAKQFNNNFQLSSVKKTYAPHKKKKRLLLFARLSFFNSIAFINNMVIKYAKNRIEFQMSTFIIPDRIKISV